MITAEHIAQELGVTGRKLRGFLRNDMPRPEHEKHQRWLFSRDEANEVKRRFSARFN